MNTNQQSAIQVPKEHYFGSYDHSRRWSSYWIQIAEALNCPVSGPVLEVGVGNGIVAHYLKHIACKEVTTLDIDPELRPDIVGDILDIPFSTRQFGLCMACEIIEHLPWDSVATALSELRRVAQRGIISVPSNESAFQVRLSVGAARQRTLKLPLPKIPVARPLRVPHEHYWELGSNGIREDDLNQKISAAGWEIEKSFRNTDNLFHQFFVLR